jgi:hypothetical protein
MKIGIITINSQNMGNRLQNYAVQQVLQKLGHQVETLNNSYCGREVTTLKHTLKICVTGRTFPGLFEKRREGFKHFNDNYINMNERLWSPDKAPSGIEDEFDYFICGSDQIWNPHFDFITGNEFLEFARPEQKIAFAASIGVDEIPKLEEERFRKRLHDFKAISVREKSGAHLISKILGREVPVLMDPTLMLSREEWLKFAKEPKELPVRKYLLTYFLGQKSNDTLDFIQKTAKANNLEIVNLWDIKQKRYFLTNPSEFLFYIANCEMMLTDSFHGVIFSIIMGVSFSVFWRKDKAKNMSTRLETLLGTLKLENHFNTSKTIDESLFMQDYSEAYEIIQLEKKRSNEYLMKVLRGD